MAGDGVEVLCQYERVCAVRVDPVKAEPVFTAADGESQVVCGGVASSGNPPMFDCEH